MKWFELDFSENAISILNPPDISQKLKSLSKENAKAFTATGNSGYNDKVIKVEN